MSKDISGGPEKKDIFFMEMALAQAAESFRKGEVPVGAVMVREDTVLAKGYNRRESHKDATAHAEMLVIKEACNLLGGWRLPGTTLYVTLEPCPMCAGALVMARVERLVFGAYDPKGGSAGTLYNIVEDHRLNHKLQVAGGVLGEKSAALLQDFFHSRRQERF